MCKPNKYFPPQIGFGPCFSTATEAKLGQIGTTERDITEIGLIKDFSKVDYRRILEFPTGKAIECSEFNKLL